VTGMAVPQAQAGVYRDDGFVLVRGLFTAPEAEAWVGECERLEASGLMHPDNLRTHVLHSTRPPDRLDPVVDLSPVFRELAFGERLTALAGELLGDDAVLFKDKLIFKPAGTRGYLAHQDYAYWQWLPAPPAALVTVLVALDAATVENGAVELFAGFHDRLLTEPGGPADVPDGVLPERGLLAETAPGDVVGFHSLTPHRSGDNRTSLPRRQLFLSYGAARYGDLYRRYYDGLQASVLAAMAPDARARAYFR
jgi:2-aminoethylphosphonate dioxygenase